MNLRCDSCAGIDKLTEQSQVSQDGTMVSVQQADPTEAPPPHTGVSDTESNSGKETEVGALSKSASGSSSITANHSLVPAMTLLMGFCVGVCVCGFWGAVWVWFLGFCVGAVFGVLCGCGFWGSVWVRFLGFCLGAVFGVLSGCGFWGSVWGSLGAVGFCVGAVFGVLWVWFLGFSGCGFWGAVWLRFLGFCGCGFWGSLGVVFGVLCGCGFWGSLGAVFGVLWVRFLGCCCGCGFWVGFWGSLGAVFGVLWVRFLGFLGCSGCGFWGAVWVRFLGFSGCGFWGAVWAGRRRRLFDGYALFSGRLGRGVTTETALEQFIDQSLGPHARMGEAPSLSLFSCTFSPGL